MKNEFMVDKAIDDPFQPEGMIRDINRFFGREHELRFIWGRLRGRGHISIVAERRMGKSSLLWYVKEKAADELKDLEAHYIDMQLIPDEQAFLAQVAKLLSSQVPTWLKVWDSLNTKSLVLCIDEFERTTKHAGFTADPFAGLRGLAQSQNLSLVVASRTPLIELSLSGDLSSPFFNIFPEPLKLGPLDENAARQLLSLGLPSLDEATIKQALNLSGCIPWKVQLIGSKLVRSPGDWDKAKSAYNVAMENGALAGAQQAPTPRARAERVGRRIALVGALGIIAILIGIVGGMAGGDPALKASGLLILITLGLTVFYLYKLSRGARR